MAVKKSPLHALAHDSLLVFSAFVVFLGSFNMLHALCMAFLVMFFLARLSKTPGKTHVQNVKKCNQKWLMKTPPKMLKAHGNFYLHDIGMSCNKGPADPKRV